MLSLSVREPLRRVLAIGCHADDIEIGCGGTLLTLTRSNPSVEVDWVILASPGQERATEARASAEAFLAKALAARVEVHGFRDGFLPYVGAEVKDVFEGMKHIDPQVVFTHSGYDFHQDHRLAHELTWNTFRNHLILEYEIPKVDGDIGRPNFYVPLTAEVVEEKLSLLEKHFPTQVGKHWFDRDTFSGLMRLRGMEAVAPERFAEGFTCRKAVLGF
jgi:LmbE family N-acetylglucosaminyl deacetylase